MAGCSGYWYLFTLLIIFLTMCYTEATSTVVPRSILRNAQASTPLSSDVRRRSVSTPIRFDLSMPWKSLNRKTLKSSSNVNSTPDNNKQSLMEGTPTMLEDHTQTVLRKKHKKIGEFTDGLQVMFPVKLYYWPTYRL